MRQSSCWKKQHNGSWKKQRHNNKATIELHHSHVTPESPEPRSGTKQIFWSIDVSFGLVFCGPSFGLVSIFIGE